MKTCTTGSDGSSWRFPPLRARREDIPLLVEHFRLQYNERHGLAIDGVTDAAMEKLESYPWPGNVREFEAVLEQAMIFRGRGWVAPRDLDLRPVTHEIAEMAYADVHPVGYPTMTPYQAEALRIAGRRGEVRRRDLVRRFGISREVARRQLVALAQAGLLHQVGSGRGARYVLGRRPEGP